MERAGSGGDSIRGTSPVGALPKRAQAKVRFFILAESGRPGAEESRFMKTQPGGGALALPLAQGGLSAAGNRAVRRWENPS